MPNYDFNCIPNFITCSSCCSCLLLVISRVKIYQIKFQKIFAKLIFPLHIYLLPAKAKFRYFWLNLGAVRPPPPHYFRLILLFSATFRKSIGVFRDLATVQSSSPSEAGPGVLGQNLFNPLFIFHLDYLKNRMNSSFTSNHPSVIHSILNSKNLY